MEICRVTFSTVQRRYKLVAYLGCFQEGLNVAGQVVVWVVASWDSKLRGRRYGHPTEVSKLQLAILGWDAKRNFL